MSLITESLHTVLDHDNLIASEEGVGSRMLDADVCHKACEYDRVDAQLSK